MLQMIVGAVLGRQKFTIFSLLFLHTDKSWVLMSDHYLCESVN